MGNRTKVKQRRLFKSIRGKLILLGVVAMLTTLILGITGIAMINRNNGNTKVLEDVNKINVLLNANQTAEANFLYSLDDSYNDEIMQNIDSMTTAVNQAKKYGDAGVRKNLESVEKNISQNQSNMTELRELYSKRSFSKEQGLYADFLAEDENLKGTFAQMLSESEWVDGPWVENDLASVKTVKIDGKNYKHIKYETSIPETGKRNYILIRLGNDGIKYTGNVYMNNVTFDGSTTVDLSGMTKEQLGESYGDGISGLDVAKFNNTDSITFKANFIGGQDWREASIAIPLSDYNIRDYKKASVDLYLEEKETPIMKVAIAYNRKYDFDANLENLNDLFSKYSMTVAEGKDATDQATAIENKIAELKENISLYTLNEDYISAGTASMEKIESIFAEIKEADLTIVSLKNSNNTSVKDMASAISKIQNDVEKQNNVSKTSMLTLIIVVLVVGVALIALLAVYVIQSVQKSIRGFKSTLTGISEGKLSVRAQTGSGDEFDVFGQSLNSMAETLTGTLKHVNDAADELSQSGNKLEQMAQNTSDTSEQMKASIHGIASGATEQAENVEDSTNQIQNMGDIMDKMVENVNQLDVSAGNMERASEEAKNILDDLSVSNYKMTDGVEKIADQIERTNRSVEEIREAVSLISEIASQTNLLSLNASIEAARAGEAGKGFAVVASEISQLADQSDQSADKISDVINKLTQEFKQTLQIMEEVSSATEEQNKKLEATQNQFLIVGEGISNSRAETSMIKELIEECNHVRIHVSDLMSNLSAISEENAASTTETEEAMRVLNDTFAELLESSQRFVELSSGLEKEMSSFEF